MPLILQSPARIKFLRSINELLLEYKDHEDANALAKAVAMMVTQQDFAKALASNTELNKEITDEAGLKRVAWAYLYHHLALRDYVSAALILWGPDMFTPEPRFAQLIWDALFTQTKVNVMGCASAGKCLGPDVGVLMFDGTIKKAKDVRKGDLLMGDDSKPRKVLVKSKGIGQLYKITPQTGESWICNDAHILSLRCGWNHTCGSGAPSKTMKKGNVIDVPIQDYMKWSARRKRVFLQFSVGCEFPEKPIPYDAYCYGAWLGDGGTDLPILHTPEGGMSRRWCEYFTSIGFRVSVGHTKQKCHSWCVRTTDRKGNRTNEFWNFTRTSSKNKEKFILQDYLINSRENRMQLLAGLIDSDGTVSHRAFEVTTKFKELANQISFLARSLGFSGHKTIVKKQIKSIGFEGTYYVVRIGGEGVDKIPTREKFIPFDNRTVFKTCTNTGFEIEDAGIGEYHGFVIDGNHRFLLSDFTVTHNTFCASAWGLLDWLLDPEWTRVEVASNSEEHVKKNLFGDLVRLHQGASLELPGRIDTSSISLNKKTGQGIFVLVIPGGPRARGKAKGAKCKGRPFHPIFGKWSRIRFIFDEAQEIAPNIFDDIPNIFASIGQSEDGSEDTEHIKVFMAANPKDEFSRYGQNCTPPGGWDGHDDSLEFWRSTKGWHTVRLNAMRSENVIAKKEIFPRLISLRGVNRIIEEAGSDQDPIVYSQVYAKFPPMGMMATIIKPEHIRRSQGEWIFSSATWPLYANDPAFTGDAPGIASGRAGTAVAWIDYEGVRHELKEPGIKIQVDATGALTRGDTQDMTDENLSRCSALRVDPQRFAIDRTGVGQGVYDISCRQWAQKVAPLPDGEKSAPILGVHYSESPSEIKIADEDTKTPKELYDNVATELWMAAGKLFEYDVIRMGRGVELLAFEELSGRRGGMKVGIGRKLAIEAKKTYKARTGRPSPDRADTVTLLIHAARMTIPNIIPKAKDTKTDAPPPRDPWGNFTLVEETMPIRGYEGHSAIESMQD